MNYNAEVRRALKKECRERVQAQFGRCIGVQLLYMIPSVLITMILYIAIFGKAFNMVLSGSRDENTIASVLAEGMNSSAVWVMALAMILVTGPLTYGMMQFYIKLRRGEEPGVSTLLEPFTSLQSIWMGIKMEFCLSFRSMIWMMIPGFVASVVGTFLSMLFDGFVDERMRIITVIAYLVYFIAQLPVKVKLKEYEAGWVLENDRDGLGVWEATRVGSEAFFGRFGMLFTFMMSFLGWYILEFGLVSVCLLLAVYGLIMMGNTIGLISALLAFLAMLCIIVVLSSFLSAYQNTSFFALYEMFASSPHNFHVAEKEDGFFERDRDTQDGT